MHGFWGARIELFRHTALNSVPSVVIQGPMFKNRPLLIVMVVYPFILNAYSVILRRELKSTPHHVHCAAFAITGAAQKVKGQRRGFALQQADGLLVARRGESPSPNLEHPTRI
ncbi:hypothetical protein T265_08994 [Opisthorchis viverrini]|uniref:Uncharacterized protein n=1 Tax=Opisthorchis viverrini TaxID=6198 RepID=A0A075A6I7_OPIVI|nr:hypothetical protein T265_08994 [Opisthorchis viverrini]KER23054.1 hypothetical protein T265_08994 [Opisthorchis viverrini]